MPKSTKAINPFYSVLVVVGILFVITVCAYFVMTLRDANTASESPPHPLLTFVEDHGLTALTIELVVLGVATFGAIGTDDYWERRRRRQLAIERDLETASNQRKDSSGDGAI